MIGRFFHPVWLLMAASGMSCASPFLPRGEKSAIRNPKSATPSWRSAIRNWHSALRIPHSAILNVAHRGVRSLAPENTLAALRKALQVGADGWEVDVHPTRDGRLVVIHDDTIDRTTNARKVFPDRKPWNVSDFTLDEIRSLDAGSWFGRDDPFGQIKAGAVSADEVKSYVGEKVPTLDEVLRFTRESGRLLDIEIKQMPRRYPDVVEKVAAAVTAERMEEQIIISCFDHTCVARIKSLNRKIMAGPISNDRVADPARYVKSVVRGDAWFASGQVVGTGSLAFAGSNTVAASYKAADLNVDDLRAVRKAGIGMFVWTINDEATMRGLIEAGVTGIVTDFPQRLASLSR